MKLYVCLADGRRFQIEWDKNSMRELYLKIWDVTLIPREKQRLFVSGSHVDMFNRPLLEDGDVIHCGEIVAPQICFIEAACNNVQNYVRHCIENELDHVDPTSVPVICLTSLVDVVELILGVGEDPGYLDYKPLNSYMCMNVDTSEAIGLILEAGANLSWGDSDAYQHTFIETGLSPVKSNPPRVKIISKLYECGMPVKWQIRMKRIFAQFVSSATLFDLLFATKYSDCFFEQLADSSGDIFKWLAGWDYHFSFPGVSQQARSVDRLKILAPGLA